MDRSEEDMKEIITDGPSISADNWFAMAVSSAIISGVLTVIVALWIFSADGELMRLRSQSFAPFGAGMLAIVTFCTVAWRGILNTKALEYQNEQLKYQGEQIKLQRLAYEAKGEETISTIFINATKLISEKDASESQILAGIAALNTVISTPSELFGVQAMDIVAGVVVDGNKEDKPVSLINAALMAMDAGARRGKFATKDYISENSNRIVNGFASTQYSSQSFLDNSLRKVVDWQKFKFSDCRFVRENIGPAYFVESSSRRCSFYRCKIIEMDFRVFSYCTFIDCDFSNASFVDIYNDDDEWKDRYFFRALPKLKREGCFYVEGRSPKTELFGVQWDKFLNILSEHDFEKRNRLRSDADYADYISQF